MFTPMLGRRWAWKLGAEEPVHKRLPSGVRVGSTPSEGAVIRGLACYGLNALSGGQQQLVSLGQALVRKPAVRLTRRPPRSL